MRLEMKKLEPIVEFSHVTMDFPGIRANDDVSLSIRKGEVFALVGENGAGKSTLMNILYGILTPTAGQVRIKGEQVTHFNPKFAMSKQGCGHGASALHAGSQLHGGAEYRHEPGAEEGRHFLR